MLSQNVASTEGQNVVCNDNNQSELQLAGPRRTLIHVVHDAVEHESSGNKNLGCHFGLCAIIGSWKVRKRQNSQSGHIVRGEGETVNC